MGKAKRWFKRLVAKLRSDSNPHDKPLKPFTNEAHSNRIAAEANSSSSSAPEVPEYDIDETRNHSIRVTSQAVVKLNSSRICYAAPSPQRSAALVIQSHFRGHLARRALRALKGLVKLQALVRGHITRRKTAETMRRIEAMLRAQARAISLRSYGSPISSDKSSHIYHPGPQTPEKLEMTSYSRVSSNTQSPILSKGSGSMSRSINRVIIHPDNTYLNSPGWSESQSNRQHGFFYDPLKNLSQSVIQDESVICTAENSPQLYHSVSSKGGSTSSRRQSPMMTPTKSDTSAASCLSGYSDCPAYMAYTESSKAKVRASSVPRNRPQQCGKTATSAATRACFASKAYTGSGRFDRLGMMVKNNTNAYNSGCLNQGV